MKKFILSLFGGMILCLSSVAQDIRIAGRVTDAAGIPLDFVNVVWLSLPDSAYVQGAVTDGEGRFKLDGEQTEGVLRFSFVGYADEYRPVEEGDIGIIVMTPDENLLNEVVVRAEPPRTRIKNDALVTNVAGTLLEKAGTAEDLLDRIPGVTSHGGQVNVLGRGNALVYINGRQMRNPLELDQLASSNIRSVEVISNPGARYPASVKAVVRIRTKKPQGEGWSFGNRTVGGYGTGWEWREQLSFNYRKDDFDLGGSLTGYDRRTERESRIVQDTYLDKHWNQDLRLNEKEHYRNVSAQLNLNYVFGKEKEQALGGYYHYNRTPLYDTRGSMNTDVRQDGDLTEILESTSAGPSQTTTHITNLYYSGRLGNWQMDFNADGYWNHDDNSSRIDEQSSLEGHDRVVEDHTRTDNKLYAAKLTAGHTLWGGQLTLGTEYAYMHRKNDYCNLSGIIDNDLNRIREHSVAAFAEYARQIGKVYLQAGLRYEHVNYDYFDNNIHSAEQSKKYDNLFPSVSFSGQLGQKMQWMLSYGTDIDRPSYHSLRGNIQYNNPYTYESGNPLLQPTLTHNVQLALVYDWLMFNAFYERTRDAIITASRPYSNERPDIAVLMPENAPAYDALTMQLYASKEITHWWKPEVGVGFRKQWFELQTTRGKRMLGKPLWLIQVGSDFTLPAGFLLTLKFDWENSPQRLNTETLTNSWIMRFIVNKSFLNNQLNLQLHVNDIFNTNRLESVTYLGRIHDMYQWTKPNSRSVTLTLRYNFNAARSKYRGTGAGNKQKARM